MAVKKKKKKKYTTGGLYLQQEQIPQQQGLMMEEVADTGSMAGSVGGGAAKGAMAGSSAGPVGTIVGAGIGAVTGAMARGKQEDAIAQQNKIIALGNAKTAFGNAGVRTLKNGGKLAKNLNLIGGGELTQISPDAVKVQANNPAATDSVELEDAYVDHNEVIDKKNRVFSDEVIAPSGKTVAKEAAKLEKMKGESSRFGSSNNRIEAKLNELFNYQETTKKQAFSKGGIKKRIEIGGELPDPTYPVQPQRALFEKRKDLGTGQDQEQVMHTLANDNDAYLPIWSTHERKWHDDGTLWINDAGNLEKKPFYAPLKKQQTFKDVSNDPELSKYYTTVNLNDMEKEKQATGGFIKRKLLNPDQVKKGTPINVAPPTKPGDELKKKLGKAKGGKLKPKLLYGVDDLTNPPDLKKKPGFLDSSALPKQEFKVTNEDFGLNTGATGQSFYGSPTGSPATEVREDGFATAPNVRTGPTGQQVMTGIATYAPNIVNAFLQKKIKGPRDPKLENQTRLERVSARPQLASAARATNQAQKAITSGTAGAGNLASATGNLLAKRLEAENQIYGNVNNQNIGIGNQEASMNQAVGARNIDRTNRFRENLVEFQNKKLQLTSENVANLSGKIQSQGRERNMMNLDKQKYAILKQRYSELPQLMKDKYQTEFDFYNSPDYKENQLYGGLLRKAKKLNTKKLGGKLC